MTHKEFADKLRQFCSEHGFEIAGTCYSEGIYGEISVVRFGENPGWLDWEKNKFNFVMEDVVEL